ncbi:hypothetical protein [Actinophytocola xanthii]|uniref:Uncharacterized protein n=1 Tax=Actinophytocola xanthii TaxID=1912961 RepID=A0A1Q8CGJ3_9PSEU|nr:hypothetical protein [Actinophytocola xanthii]OLF13464.1 hypothetical protein BU204_27080 [Actinophytocola xanthii]
MISPFSRYLCLSVDAQGYSRRNDDGQAGLQRELVTLLDDAATTVGLNRTCWHRQGTGDGELALVPPSESESLVVQDFTLVLARRLFSRNAGRFGAERLRLRMAVDHGLARVDANGFAGATVVSVARMVDAQALRAVLDEADSAPLVQVLSDHLYHGLVEAGHVGSPAEFRTISLRHKEFHAQAWVRAPGVDLRLTAAPDSEPPPVVRPDGQVVTATFLDSVDVNGGVIGIRNS